MNIAPGDRLIAFKITISRIFGLSLSMIIKFSLEKLFSGYEVDRSLISNGPKCQLKQKKLQELFDFNV